MIAPHSAPEVETYLYRGGFLCAAGSTGKAVPTSWTGQGFGSRRLYLHPDARCAQVAEDRFAAALIGMAFDPEEPSLDERGILEELRRLRREGGFLDRLDRLGGRFALLFEKNGELEAYHDAFGARSIFYSETSGAVGSHAEIVAAVDQTPYADFFIPFLTSRNYVFRDVKHLPGCATPYEGVRQLTPNTRLRQPGSRVERYWPREPLGPAATEPEATAALVAHLSALADYLRRRSLRPLIGFTAGTDSRGALAACRNLDPFVFTWVRSSSGESVRSEDADYASRVTQALGLEGVVWPIRNPTLSTADSPLGYAYRRSTAYYRAIDSGWLHELSAQGFDYGQGVFVRGFGGEILRGFYQKMQNSLQRISPAQLANAYDVNAGSSVTRLLFQEFMERTDFNDAALKGRDPNDMFYWEHRMGTWGSVAMSEADLAASSLIAYGSRELYDTFFRLSWEARDSRVSFRKAVEALAPDLAAQT